MVEVLRQEVPFRQNAANEDQKFIEPISAQIPMALKGQQASDGIQLGNICMPV